MSLSEQQQQQQQQKKKDQRRWPKKTQISLRIHARHVYAGR